MLGAISDSKADPLSLYLPPAALKTMSLYIGRAHQYNRNILRSGAFLDLVTMYEIWYPVRIIDCTLLSRACRRIARWQEAIGWKL
jgi:hypothetical protein